MNLPPAYTREGSLPLIGEISMFFGDISVFPTATHALCDGNNGTPDIRGQFIRGWSDGDDQEYPGSTARRNDTQLEAIQAHTHEVNYDNNGSIGVFPSSATNRGISAFFSQSTQSTGGPETRPKNYALALIMRIA